MNVAPAQSLLEGVFLLPGSNSSAAPRCSVIADVEFHFCSSGPRRAPGGLSGFAASCSGRPSGTSMMAAIKVDLGHTSDLFKPQRWVVMEVSVVGKKDDKPQRLVVGRRCEISHTRDIYGSPHGRLTCTAGRSRFPRWLKTADHKYAMFTERFPVVR